MTYANRANLSVLGAEIAWFLEHRLMRLRLLAPWF
jgi:hypothetical protein